VSFEYYYITVVSLVIFIVALVIAIIMNSRYYKVIREYLVQARGAEAKGQAMSGEVEVLACPRCGYSTTIPFRVGDYVGKVVGETCPKDGERLVVVAIYSLRPTEYQGS